MEDMRMTGKRHPYSADYKIGLDKDLSIIAYSATFYQNAGAACDLSLPVLERTLFHATNSYFIPNVSATAFTGRIANVVETPAGNWTNNYNRIRIDWFTGRARVEQLEAGQPPPGG
jgi:xanthine dehydrogenase molybdopterin-binding subunit B